MMFILHILLFSALILSTNQQQVTALFEVSLFGIDFSPVNSSDLILIQTGIRSMTRCAAACLTNIKCYTVGYDSSTLVCRLFSVWVYKGTIIQSASLPTSRIAYIEQKPILYLSYGQLCNALYSVNRFLWCTNGLWSCPTGQFFNGSICLTIITTTTTTTSSTTSITTTVMAAPTNLLAYRGNNGRTYTFVLTGTATGGLWGTTIYTDDSTLSTAAVHSGFVQFNQRSIVTVMILPGQSSYTSTTQNGITSSPWGSWSGSYSFVSATAS